MRPALKVADDQWSPVFRGQALEFVGKHGSYFPILHGMSISRSSSHGGKIQVALFKYLPFSPTRPSAESDPVTDLVQPSGQSLAPANGAGPAHERHESGLKCVFGILFVSKHMAAHAQNHRPMPPHQHLKSRLIAPANDTLQKLCIWESTTRPAQAVQMTHDATKR
jgi:hypothetical protein